MINEMLKSASVLRGVLYSMESEDSGRGLLHYASTTDRPRFLPCANRLFTNSVWKMWRFKSRTLALMNAPNFTLRLVFPPRKCVHPFTSKSVASQAGTSLLELQHGGACCSDTSYNLPAKLQQSFETTKFFAENFNFNYFN